MGDSEQITAALPISDHGVWGALRQPLFRAVWIAALISYIGTWMQNMAAGWLMTSLTSSPLMISMVQAAMSFPVFLIALPAGALADLVDRRRLLLITQSWMVAAAFMLAILTIRETVSPAIVLFFTFLLGLGAVMNDPAWQAITPEIVSDRCLPPAVALNAAAFNIARAVGPALAGVIIAATSNSGWVFLINAISFFGVIFVLVGWKRSYRPSDSLARHLFPAIRQGVSHVAHDSTLKAVLVRTGVFSFCASALWALLPAIARQHGSVGYGMLYGSLGLGALAGAALIHPIRRKLSTDAFVGGATLVFAGATFAASYCGIFWLECLVFICAGLGWICTIANLNLVAQTCSPDWVRARMLSMYVLVLQGGMSIGSGVWGAIADRIGIDFALTYAAIGLALGLAVIPFHSLRVTPVREVTMAPQQ